MMRRARTAVAWLLLLSTLFVGIPLLPRSASAQKRLPVELHARVVKIVSKYMAAGISLPDDLLERCGFNPAVGAAGWSHFPPAEKIEAAYHSAEDASRGGGEVWLALLAQELARRYESAANDPLLRRLVSSGKVKDCPAFSAAPQPRRSKLSATQKAVIARLASYCGSGAVGYIADTAARYMRVPTHVARRVFTRHGFDIETGLRRLSEELPEGQRVTAMWGLYEYLASHYAPLRDDAELKALMRRATEERWQGFRGEAAANPNPAPIIKRDPPPVAPRPGAAETARAASAPETATRPTSGASALLVGNVSETVLEPAPAPAMKGLGLDLSAYGIPNVRAYDPGAYSVGLPAPGLSRYDFGAPGFNPVGVPSYDLYNRGLQLPPHGAQAPFVPSGLGVRPPAIDGPDDFLRRIRQAQPSSPATFLPCALCVTAPPPAPSPYPWMWNDPILRPILERNLVDRIVRERGPLVVVAPNPSRQPERRIPAPARPQPNPPRAGELPACPDEPRRP